MYYITLTDPAISLTAYVIDYSERYGISCSYTLDQATMFNTREAAEYVIGRLDDLVTDCVPEIVRAYPEGFVEDKINNLKTL